MLATVTNNAYNETNDVYTHAKDVQDGHAIFELCQLKHFKKNIFYQQWIFVISFFGRNNGFSPKTKTIELEKIVLPKVFHTNFWKKKLHIIIFVSKSSHTEIMIFKHLLSWNDTKMSTSLFFTIFKVKNLENS